MLQQSERLDPGDYLPPRRPAGRSSAVWVRRTLVLLLLAGGFVALARADLPTRRWRVAIQTRTFPYRSLAEMTLLSLMDFGQPVAIICILVAAYVLDRRGFAIVVHSVWALVLAALMFGAIKLTLGRYRPMDFMPSAATVAGAKVDYDKTWVQTWTGVRLTGRSFRNSSFPSAHTSAAFAYGMVLAWFYPRLRWMFYVLAAGCGMSRFFWEAHWLTDVYIGAGVGTIAAYLSLRPWLYVEPLLRLIGRKNGER